MALVIPDLSNFVSRVPIILWTPTINCIVNMINEKEIDALGNALGKCSRWPISLAV